MKFPSTARLTLVGATALLALVSTTPDVAAGAAAAHASQVSVLHFKDAHSNGGRKTAPSNLVDKGGKLLPASHTYVVWWGSQSSWAGDVQSGIGSLLSGLNGSSFLNTGTQYMRGAGIGSTYEGAKIDTSAPPRNVSPSTLGAEVQKEYGTALDPAGIYIVYTSNFPSGGGFCAWHSYATVNGQSVAVAYMPNTTSVAGCDPGNLYNVPGSEGLRSLANVTSHEFMEAVTDALPGSGTYAWIDSSGEEIGDKCAWQFSSAVTLSNGSVWQLQKEWSNAISGCAETT